ncbi:protein-disulfide reductase DsbD N-terminal domain-containing protein [Pedobacter sp. Leaf250]|uniref:protein-disulfide reductase DsbD N-terminal domain-containing protein n=1 Tax=Pedobacter sp. Leaf250 TaxID=2876559 RepID=UPI001E328FB9|nr:protein-disulfide reductase DsbD N-terminal domain-containing protein [Pedobacter sp. Leaf250]
MKKNLIVCCLFILIGISAKSQILKPVTWSYAAKKTGPKTATLYIKAKIDKGWHLYSQYVKEGGPVKTSFAFATGKGFELVGKTIEPKPVTKYEEIFKMNVSYFENSVVFQQKIKLTGSSATVKGTVESMVCNDHQCLPPEEIPFSINVK